MLTEMEKKALEQARSVKQEEVEEVDFTSEGEADVPIPTDVGGENEETIPKQKISTDELSSEDVERFTKMTALEPEVVEETREEEPKVEPEAAPKPDDKDGYCPRCGCDLETTGIVEPTDEDKNEFIRSLLGERRFNKVYEFIGGKVKIKMRSTHIHEEQAIVQLVIDGIKAQEIVTPENWQAYRDEVRLCYILEEVEIEGTNKKLDMVNADAEDMEKLKERIDKKIKHRNKFPSALAGMFAYAMNDFDELYTTLTARTYDSDFWTGLTGSEA